MKDRMQLFYITVVDLAMDVSDLDTNVVLADAAAWKGLLEAAKPRPDDHRDDVGYVVKAGVSDAGTGDYIASMSWLDLCNDQVERMWEHLCAITAAR